MTKEINHENVGIVFEPKPNVIFGQDWIELKSYLDLLLYLPSRKDDAVERRITVHFSPDGMPSFYTLEDYNSPEEEPKNFNDRYLIDKREIDSLVLERYKSMKERRVYNDS